MKIAIAGGFYGETCIDPEWHEMFGPGGRAAAALARRGVEVELHSYCEEARKPQTEFQAMNFGFGLVGHPCPFTVAFHYLHFLSVPVIVPPPGRILKQPTFKVSADVVIRYGLLEGDAQVHGEKVVYDPQDAFSPRFFSENGSTAQQLVVVSNITEARLLTNRAVPEEMAEVLLTKENAKAVIIKMGGEGAIVRTATECVYVPAHYTPTVRKIGSGDVYSAEFAYGWAVLNLDPVAAAKRASLQTAYYCEYQTLPIKSEVTLRDLPKAEYPSLAPASSKQYDVYLAGPFFSLAERWLIEEARGLLQSMGLRVFSPIHIVGDGPAKIVAQADLKGLDDSRFVFACLDGFDPGTIFEIGYAHAKGIPILCYGRNLSEQDTVMFEGTGCNIISDFVSAIYRAAFWNKKRE
jgi:Nucleoside 2-deoxyribosyltransferase/pfkB family carbohydrate kinase